MSFYINIPGQNESLALWLQAGEALILLGVNGSGKSAIIDKLYKDNRQNVIKVHSMRQNWFKSGNPDITQSTHNSFQHSLEAWDRCNSSWYNDDNAATKVNMILYDLINSENRRSRKITNIIDTSDDETTKKT
ncbi:MAG: hypothetical protein LBP92_13125 [Deltaproteobacteria bacterium]|jgi:ABC-type cobalamin/Fe3+-siderophores transport system ATPase subunit|nr:hypothetical protein [Deltaproteobacteria bacterium]